MLSIKSKDNGKQSEQTSPHTSTYLSNSTYHSSCSTLPYNIFLQIQLTRDITLLTIKGNVDPEILAIAWDKIVEECADLIKTDKADNIFQLVKKIRRTDWQIFYLEKALNRLKVGYSEYHALRIQELGYDLIKDLEDNEAYLKQIYLVENEAKTLIILLNQYIHEYNLYNLKTNSEEKDLMHYEKELRILSKFIGHKLLADEITVFYYYSVVNAFFELNKKKSHGATI